MFSTIQQLTRQQLTIAISLLTLTLLLLIGVYSLMSLRSNSSSLTLTHQPSPTSPNTSNPEIVSSGYNLFSPLSSTQTYLIDNDGQLIHSWDSNYTPGHSVYLLENGNLLRTGKLNSSVFSGDNVGGIGGIVEEFDWDGNLLWSYQLADKTSHLHHDIAPMPNGHILMIAWDYIPTSEAVAAGMTNTPASGLWSDKLIEVNPDNNQIVWQWRAWDHLGTQPQQINPHAYQPRDSDWLHINSIAYNPELDQILVSAHNFNEIWIIDHKLTGKLLYRWGDPSKYTNSPELNQDLFAQHDASWIPYGYPGAGNILIFNNGNRQRPYSTVIEISPPLTSTGEYNWQQDSHVVWEYQADNPSDFYAERISGANRLANGDTLICNGPAGYSFEVDNSGSIVWEYTNPIQGSRDNSNSVFRFERYPLDYPAFTNRDLSQKGTLQP